MGETLRWIIVLASEWEPSEEEQAQFIAEVVNTRFPEVIQEFSYVPQQYTQQEDIEIFSDDKTTFAAFASVPSDVLTDDNIVPYLRANMPACIRVAENFNCDIYWDAYSHPDGYPCILVCLGTSPGPGAEDAGESAQRKMVQQIRGSRKDTKDKGKRALSPISRVQNPVVKKIAPLMPPRKKADRNTGGIHISQDFQLKEQPPPDPVSGKTEKIGQTPAASAPAASAPAASAPAASAPTGPTGATDEWSSFLDGLAPSAPPPEEPPKMTPEIQKAQKLSPSRKAAHIPTMYSHFQGEQEPKKSGFEEWSDFLEDLGKEVETQPAQPASQAGPQSTPPPAPHTPHPMTSGTEVTKKSKPGSDWKMFVSDLDKEVESKGKQEPAKEEATKEEKSESRVFQGRGLILSTEELALEQAIKKHESKKQVTRKMGPKLSPGRDVPTPTPLGIPAVGEGLTPTLRRSISPMPAQPGMSPQVIPIDPKSSVPPLKLGVESDPRHTMARKAPDTGISGPPKEQQTRAVTKEAAIDTAGEDPSSAGERPQKSKFSRLWLWLLLFVLATGGGGGYMYRAQLLEQWHKIKSGWSQSKPIDEQALQYQAQYEEFQKKIENPSLDARVVAEHLTTISAFGETMISKPNAEKWIVEAQRQKKALLDKTRQFLQENANTLANEKKAVEAIKYLAEYEKTRELQDYSQELQYATVALIIKELWESKEYVEGVEALLDIFANHLKVNHKLLDTRRNILCFVHLDVLASTASNDYASAQEKIKSYRQKISAVEPYIGISDEVALLCQQVDAEEKYWKQLVAGVTRMDNAGKKGNRYKLSVVENGKSSQISGKIIAQKGLKETGEFKIDKTTVTIRQLPKDSHRIILKESGERILEQDLAYNYGLFLFSRGKLEEARQEFELAKKSQEYNKKIEYYRQSRE